MRAQGLSTSIDSSASAGSGTPPPVLPPLPPRRRRAPAPLAVLYPACLAVADGWAMAAAVAVARGAGPDGA
ncbi:hypothetical protein, partial [Actinomadura montaniterrae]